MEDNFVIIHKNQFFKVKMDSNINIQKYYFTDKIEKQTKTILTRKNNLSKKKKENKKVPINGEKLS